MIAYFDTSALIPLLINEPESATAGQFWNRADRILSVRLLYPEAHAALALAERTGRLSRNQLATSVSQLRELVTQVDHIEVTGRLAHRAGVLAEQQALRGYDALHLAAAASVADEDLVLVAGDADLLRGARALGINTAPVR